MLVYLSKPLLYARYRLILISLIVLFLSTIQEVKAVFYVSSTNPADGATSLGRDPSFTISFGINACPYSVQVYIKKASDDSTVDTITFMDYTGGGTPNLTFTSHVTLDPTTAYYVDVSGGAFSDCAPGFTNLSDTYRIDFTTGTCTGSGTCSCYNPPSCIGPCFGTDDIDHLSPPDNAHFMQSYEGLAIVFGSNVTLGTGNLYIREYVGDATVSTIDVTSGVITGWGTNTLTINIPDNVLANNTHYYINFDIEGWSLPANKDNWDFWTKSTPNTFSGSGL